MDPGVFSDYEPEGFFDEAFSAPGQPRPHYERLVRFIEQLGDDELARRAVLRDASFRTKGITFTLSGDEDGLERTFPMDLLPRIIPADEWAVVEAGLAQRVRTLNKFLDDIYAGEQAAIRDGIIPRHVVTSSDGFAREAMGIHVPHGARCVVAGIDLVRDINGVYRVLEDNVRNPSGVSYVLENRAATARILPRVLGAHAVRRVDDYGPLLLNALRAISPSGGSRPRIAVLTPGPYNSAYFEHVFAARQLGAELVEGRDLVVDDHVVYMRTTNGLERVDVIYRRIDDQYLDAVGFHSTTMIGVSGLLAAVRAGNVSLANSIGNGAADDKLVYAFVPDLIRYYLGEEPILPNVPTYLLWNPEQRAEALSRLHELVVKPVARRRWLRRDHRPARDRGRARRGPQADRGRPPRLDRAGGGVALASPHADRRRAQAAPRRPAAVRDHPRRRHRGDPRRAHARRADRGLAHRELVAGWRLEGHLGPRRRRSALMAAPMGAR